MQWASSISPFRAVAIPAQHLKAFGVSVSFNPKPQLRGPLAQLIFLAMLLTAPVYVITSQKFYKLNSATGAHTVRRTATQARKYAKPQLAAVALERSSFKRWQIRIKFNDLGHGVLLCTNSV